MRKTIKVSDLVRRANRIMLHTSDEGKQAREAIFNFTSNFLHETGNYKGFGYLTQENMRKSDNGKSFGVLPYNPTDPEADRFVGTDDSRRFFY